MAQYRITGGVTLSGSLTIAGRKNAALKLVAASLLSDQPVTIHRLPDIGDVQTMLDIIRQMGGKVDKLGEESYRLDTSTIQDPTVPSELGGKLRASLVLVGPLLARFKRAVFPHPGGCVIGRRTIAPHLQAFERLGATIQFDGQIYHLSVEKLIGSEIYLKERSVTGTENLIMAATRAKGTTTIYNAAEEPHIVNLCNLLRGMGYQIQGDGSSKIKIDGQPELTTRSAEETVIPDDIEVGTFAVAAILTKGEVTLHKVGNRLDLLPLFAKFDDFNVQYQYFPEDQSLAIYPSPNLRGSNLQTGPWPAFPSDLQSPFTILATQAVGTSLIHDWMYEGRIYFVDLLHRMGADCVICDPHRALVTGPTKLRHSSMITPDLRAGAALVLAALTAEGTSVVEHAEFIERGYAKLDERLKTLGAQIIREE